MRFVPIILGVMLLACGEGNGVMTATPEMETSSPALVWTPIKTDDPSGLFMSVWGASSEDIWIVGGQENVGSLMRGTAQEFTHQTLPSGTPLINWVHGSGPTDVWLAGLHGTLLHWDGGSFTDFSLPIEEAIWGIFARNPNDAIAVGGSSRYGGTRARIFHWNGAEWSELSLPEALKNTPNLFKVSHDGQDYWIVGETGMALKGDGVNFSSVSTGYADSLVTVDAEGDSLVAVGGRGTGAIFEQEDAGLALTLQTNSGLSGVFALDDGQAVVVGERGFTGIYQPDTDSLTAFPFETHHLLHAVWAEPQAGVFAVGGNFYETTDYVGLLLWSPHP